MIFQTERVLLCVLFFYACGKNSAKNSGNPEGSSQANYFAVSDIDGLTCDATNKDQIVYDTTKKVLYLCQDDNWLAVETSSEKLDSLEEDQKNTLIKTESINVGDATCPYGGKKIIFGIDKNSDSKLDAEDGDLQEEVICFPESDGTPVLGTGSYAKGIYDRYRQSVYRIEAICLNGTTASANISTGFRCADDQVCSAQHSFNCGAGTLQSVKLYRVGDTLDSASTTPYLTISPVTVVNHATKDVAKITGISNPQNDIAFPIEVDESSAEGIPIPEALEELLVIHFPLGFFEQYVDFSYVTSNDISVCDNSSYTCTGLDFATNNNTDHGSSGSPIFSIERQKVVGILVSGTEMENANFSWAVKALYLDGL